MAGLGGQFNWWSKLKRLGEPIEVYKSVGIVRTGGYVRHIFADQPEQVDAVIRPFVSDAPHLEQEGSTGNTDEYRLYIDSDVGLDRYDRVVYNDTHLRAVSPSYDQLNHVDRFTIREDDREFLQAADVDEANEIVENPDVEHLSGVE